MNKTLDQDRFEFVVGAGSDPASVDLLLSSAGVGALGLLDLGYVNDPVAARTVINRLALSRTSGIGIRLQEPDSSLIQKILPDPGDFVLEFLVLSCGSWLSEEVISAASTFTTRVIVEVFDSEQARLAEELGASGLVIRGNEAGGLCSRESNPILLRKVKEAVSLPVWVMGGIGPESAAAFFVSGASGVVLTDSLLLTSESAVRLSNRERQSIETNPNSVAVGPAATGPMIRVSASARPFLDGLKKALVMLEERDFSEQELKSSWERHIMSVTREYHGEAAFLGEEASWAAPLAREHGCVARLVIWLRQRMAADLAILAEENPLRRDNPLAQKLGISFPILQGPMAHVSDHPGFVKEVARNRALPFAALALTRGAALEELLRETCEELEEMPWGVGLIGFAPREIQDEQLSVMRKHAPAYAVVAGGRPSHYKDLGDLGITAFLHVPVPGLIEDYFSQGVRHFIFEGRGSGGHVGPLNSFPLWQASVLQFQELARNGADLKDTTVILAGGICDSLSAAMATAFAAPLLGLGINFGVIMGTAYLFTREAVTSGALLPDFQEVAVGCRETVVLESGGGHAVRCAVTPYAKEFARKKAGMLARGQAPGEVRKALDKDNIGRLRIATRGIMRSLTGKGEKGGGPRGFVRLPKDKRARDGLYMLGEVAGILGGPLSMDELHALVCDGAARVLKDRLATVHSRNPAEPVIRGGSGYRSTDIAVIGMSALVPGAQDLDRLWHNILAELFFIREVPQGRWHAGQYYDPDPDASDMIYSSKGTFLDEVPFNSMEFAIPPRAVSSIEPSQLLVLEAVKRALSDAGYDTRPFDRRRTSVIFGTSGGGGDLALAYSVRAAIREYLYRAGDIPVKVRDRIWQSLQRVLPEWTEDSFPGILGNIAAGRVSNRFDLGGLNFTVDAACASSLAAVHVACQDLAYGTTRMAVVGGVDTTQHPFGYTCFSKTRALSPTGVAGPFDQDSDGIVLGEGVGVLVLKRAEDAVRDGDRLYAVIRGVGGASDGRGRSLTAPSSGGQAEAVRRAYEVAGYSSATLGLIEAHGTGTSLGDRTELDTMRAVLDKEGAAASQCAVGSIKSAIGHTKAAAGVLGVIKTCLALYHKVLPATLKVKKAHPEVQGGRSPIYLNTRNRPWIARGKPEPRRAGVNSFGFGGTNFHVALEEYSRVSYMPQYVPDGLWPEEMFLFFARDRAGIEAGLERLIGWSGAHEDVPLSVLALRHHEAGSGDPHLSGGARMVVKAGNRKQLRERLLSAREALTGGSGSFPVGVWFREDVPGDPGPLAMLFPGQGSQRLDMLLEPAMLFPEVRETFDEANHLLSGMLERPLSDYIFPPPLQGAQESKDVMEALTATQVAQPALAAASVALYRFLGQVGPRAGMTAGHSFGELTALWAAGAMDEGALFRLAYLRGSLMAGSAGDVETGMTAVRVGKDRISGLVEGIDQLYVANFNSPDQTVVSGSREALSLFERRCRKAGVSFHRLRVSSAFHSPFMEEAAKKWGAILEEEGFSAPLIPVYSNSVGAPYGSSPDDIRHTLAFHITSSVCFTEEIRAMYKAGARVFLEVGPGRVLAGLADSILGDDPHECIAMQPHGVNGISALLDALSMLWMAGFEVDFGHLFRVRRIGRREEAISASPTLFLVNGGSARPSVPAREEGGGSRETDRAIESWEEIIGTKRDVFQPGDRAFPVPEITTRRQVTVKENQRIAEKAMDEEKIQLIRQLQDNMDRFLDIQERLQTERRQMMSQMWEMNQAVIRAITGEVVVSPTPADSQFSGREQVGTQADNSREAGPETGQDGAGITGVGSFGHIPAADMPIGPHHRDTGRKEPDASGQETGEARADALDVASLLFLVISERTAYPVEMLKPDQHLEGDLGIDSIKRVEILGALKEKHPALSDIVNEKYFEEVAQLNTPGEIVEWIEKTFFNGGSSVSEPTPKKETVTPVSSGQPLSESSLEPSSNSSSGQEAEETPVRRYVLELTEAPAVPVSSWSLRQKTLVILGGGQGPGTLFFEHTIRHITKGDRAALVSNGEGFEALGQGRYTADFSSLDSIRQCYEAIKSDLGPVGGIVNLTAFGARDQDEGLGAVLDSFRWARTMAPDLGTTAPPGSFWISVTGLGGDFGLTGDGDFEPAQNGVHGITKTLGFEWPGVRIKTVDLSPGLSDEDFLHALFTEIRTWDGWREVCWQAGGRRQAVGLAQREVEQKAGDLPGQDLGPDSVFLITGGARGITAYAALHLAQLYSPTLILAGRSPLPQGEEDQATRYLTDPSELKAAIIRAMRARGEDVTPALVEGRVQRILSERRMRANIAGMEAQGARVHYFPVDCTDEEAFPRLIRDIYRRWGRLDGVIHGAGVIRDRLVQHKDEDSFRLVLETKVKGADILAREVDSERLSFMIFFSSVSGRFGNRGQADYAAANEILNKMAVRLDRCWPARVTAINWGPWDSDGMVSDTVRKRFEAEGVRLIPRQTGVSILHGEMTRAEKGQAEVVVFGASDVSAMLPGNAGMIQSGKINAPSAHSPLFSVMRPGKKRHEGRVWELDLDLDTMPYLNDHRLDGHPVLPAAVAMEIMAQAGVMAGTGLGFVGLRDFRLFQGIVLKDERPVKLEITASNKGASAEGFMEMEVDIHISGHPDKKRNYLSRVLLGEGTVPGPGEITRLVELAPLPMSVKEIYETRLFHQGLFQNLVSVQGWNRRSGIIQGIRGIIRPSDPGVFLKGSGKKHRWLIDPVVFDCAYQMALLWAQGYCNMMPLPSDMEEYLQFQPFGDQQLLCDVVVKKVNMPKVILDFLFLDEDNNLLARAGNVSIILSRMLNKRVLASLASGKGGQTGAGENG